MYAFLSDGAIKAFIWAAVTVSIASGLVVFAEYSTGLYTRIFGEEFPDHFARSGVPLPNPVPDDFDVDNAKPRPYRPFRWDYHQHMALKKLEHDFWIELESTYRERLAQRKQLYKINGSILMDAMPGTELASRELMEMVIQFLCARYPKQFQFDQRLAIFQNRILGNSFNIRKIDPWVFLLENIPEDFLITMKNEKTGLYELRAGIACSALGWNIATKIGKPLHEIHKIVPDYKEKMSFSMDKYFSRMKTDSPIQRGSWGLEVGQPLFMQPDDPHFEFRQKQDPDLPISDLHLRVDWQILRRLPKSQAIVFNYKALFTPMSEFRTEPYIPKLVAKVLKEGNPNIMEYKGTFHVVHKVLPLLEKWAREQEENGIVPRNWQVRTLDEDPFFPGWQKKWSLS